MFLETTIDVLPLTPDLARQVSRLPVFGGDRDRESVKGNGRIAWLKRIIEEGCFYSPHWATAEYAGKTFRVNGGHSSLALIDQADAGRTFPRGLFAVIHRFHCETERDFAELYSQFDPRRSARSFTDKLRPHLYAEKSLWKNVGSASVTYILRGIAYVFGKDGTRLDEDDRIRFVHEYGEFILWARPFMKRKWLARAGVTAAMLDTYTIDTAAASYFWAAVADQSSMDLNSPTRTLARVLQESKADPSRYRSALTVRAFYVKCIHAWNAFCEGRTSALRYSPNAPLPRVFRCLPSTIIPNP